MKHQMSVPSGKLGIVVDTTVDGPRVNRLKDGSPLTKFIFPGDLIVKIDDFETSSMSKADLAALMTRTMDKTRLFSILRKPSSSEVGKNKSAIDVPSNTEQQGDDKSVGRTVLAPAGKLGLVVDTTAGGPVVNVVKEGSPLEGLVFPGETIISINGIDTRAMSASSFTSVMVRTAGKSRTMEVASISASE